MLKFPGTFRDRLGEDAVTIEYDGASLRTEVRGVPFAGSDFDSLSPERPLSEEERGRVVLAHGDLCACTLDWAMPLNIIHDDQLVAATLRCALVLGEPDARGQLAEERLVLHLASPLGELRSSGRSGWFEDELLELQSELPSGAFLKSCIMCAHSDYSPAGHGLWGWMACFRGNKEAYAAVDSKVDLFEIWDTATERVAETHVCPEFQLRRAGTGYRG